MRIYVIHDRLAEESSPLFEAKNDLVALRSFEKALEKSEGVREGEFQLLWVGSFDHTRNIMTTRDYPSEVVPNLGLEVEKDA